MSQLASRSGVHSSDARFIIAASVGASTVQMRWKRIFPDGETKMCRGLSTSSFGLRPSQSWRTIFSIAWCSAHVTVPNREQTCWFFASRFVPCLKSEAIATTQCFDASPNSGLV